MAPEAPTTACATVFDKGLGLLTDLCHNMQAKGCEEYTSVIHLPFIRH